MFLKSNIPFLTQKYINGKSLNWTPTGYPTHLPSVDKTFSRFQKVLSLDPIGFCAEIIGELNIFKVLKKSLLG